MGVHGLTTYLRENRAALAHNIEFGGEPELRPEGLSTFVVDGWSFIYELTRCAGLPSIYGGEYDAFSGLIIQVVTAWRDVGLHVCFVFDGPYPRLKFPTLVARATQTAIQCSLLFFRTSPAARATPRFLRENSLLPPLTYTVCVRTLRQLAAAAPAHGVPRWLEVHFADEEGDPYAVALAGRRNAYVVGRDSDFVVLNADGYRGYIPVDEMVWTGEFVRSSVTSDAESVLGSADGEDDEDADGFRMVRRSKMRKRALENQLVGRDLIPPIPVSSADDDSTVLSLTCTVYSPESLAANLRLPVRLLPLFGAFVGNDFTGAEIAPSASVLRSRMRRENLQHLFFERKLTLSQRVIRVANTLRELLGPALAGESPAQAQKKRRQKQIGSTMELIEAAVQALLLRSADSMTSGELEAIGERIAQATLQYAIPRYEGPDYEPGGVDVCPLHGHGSCPLVGLLSRVRDADAPVSGLSDGEASEHRRGSLSDHHARVCALYVDTYRRGELSPRMLDVLNTGTAWPKLAMEDPDKETVSCSITRVIRKWCYSILDEGIGLPIAVNEEAEDDGMDSGDELVDVVEEDEDDLLSPLRDALGRLENPSVDDGSAFSMASSALLPPPPLPKPAKVKFVTEYVRRGTRLAAEDVQVPFFHDLLQQLAIDVPERLREGDPVTIQLWPEELRQTFFLRALGADAPLMRALKGPRLAAALSVRWVMTRLHLRAEQNPGQKEKQAERWTREEVAAFLAAFAWSPFEGEVPSVDETTSESIPIEERNIQLVTQVSLASDAIEQFAQVLLLGHLAPNPMLHFSGQQFHRALTAPSADVLGSDGSLLGACLEGVDSALQAKASKGKKKRKGGADNDTLTAVRQAQRPAHVGSMYDILAGMSA